MKYFGKTFRVIILDTFHLFYIMFPFFNWRMEIELYTEYLTPIWFPVISNVFKPQGSETQEMYNCLKEFYIDWLWFFIRIAYPLERSDNE